MKKLLCALLLVLGSTAYAADMTLPIRGGVDGDTIRSTLSLPCPLCNVSIRILGIDTPESGGRAKCEQEAVRAKQAKEFTVSLIGESKTMVVKGVKWDKYGGRINGHVFINGVDIGKALIDNGFAKPYTGQGPKPNWCE